MMYLSKTNDWHNRCEYCRERALSRLVPSHDGDDLDPLSVQCDAMSFREANKVVATRGVHPDTCQCYGRQAVLYAPIFDEDIRALMFSPAISVKECLLLSLAPSLSRFYRHCSTHHRSSAPHPLSSFGTQKHDGRHHAYGS